MKQKQNHSKLKTINVNLTNRTKPIGVAHVAAMSMTFDEFCLNLVKNGRKQIEVSKRGTMWQDNGAYLDREDFSKFGGRSGGK